MDLQTRASRRSILRATAAFGAGAVAAPWTSAQASKWPQKPIRLIVAFPPGGLTDAYARMFGEQLTQQLGATVVVENRPGAGAIIGIGVVTQAPPDGYTLLVTTSGTVWQNRVLYTKLPYNLDRDLTPIALFPSGPLVMGVHPDVPARNMREYIAYAKAKPTAMGSYAPGSYPHMVADQLNRDAGTQIQTVHYKGESPVWVDVAAGTIPAAIGSYQAFATVQPRGVRAIGVTGNYRSPKLPDVPTMVEQGIGGQLVGLEGGLPLMAPAGTPEPVLRLLSQVAMKGAETERAAKLRETFAIPNKPQNLNATRAQWEHDVPIWIKAAVDLGLKLD